MNPDNFSRSLAGENCLPPGRAADFGTDGRSLRTSATWPSGRASRAFPVTTMKTYQCARHPTGAGVCQVISPTAAYWLPMRLDLLSHGVPGFDWGNCGKESTQLSVALLSDHFAAHRAGPYLGDGLALCLYPSFRDAVLAKQPQRGFDIDTLYVRAALASIAESHGEPMALTVAAVIARDLTIVASDPTRSAPPISYEVFRARYLAALIAGVGCSPGFGERLLTLANARDLYQTLAHGS